ncbi:hypothetical protein OOK41_07630 [Micromonospora sp. NBC_01655]|uniref:hypothetical protein n=1 Tax=Micromonospora sp. NBC_01655 TaxID=2975983 RepID=UPI0022575D50|nr:hypothetical protein [Micromonospora sp. NBC_01655]MCX4470172.1 hypothetical protein [Micromonospora sp. NBC_01655]
MRSPRTTLGSPVIGQPKLFTVQPASTRISTPRELSQRQSAVPSTTDGRSVSTDVVPPAAASTPAA